MTETDNLEVHEIVENLRQEIEAIKCKYRDEFTTRSTLEKELGDLKFDNYLIPKQYIAVVLDGLRLFSAQSNDKLMMAHPVVGFILGQGHKDE